MDNPAQPLYLSIFRFKLFYYTYTDNLNLIFFTLSWGNTSIWRKLNKVKAPKKMFSWFHIHEYFNKVWTPWPMIFRPRLNDQRFLLTIFMRWTALETRKHSWHKICTYSKKLFQYITQYVKKYAKSLLYERTNSWSLSLGLKNPGPKSYV